MFVSVKDVVRETTLEGLKKTGGSGGKYSWSVDVGTEDVGEFQG